MKLAFFYLPFGEIKANNLYDLYFIRIGTHSSTKHSFSQQILGEAGSRGDRFEGILGGEGRGVKCRGHPSSSCFFTFLLLLYLSGLNLMEGKLNKPVTVKTCINS